MNIKNLVSILLIISSICIGAQQRKFVLKDRQNGREFLKNDSLAAAKFLDSLALNNYYFTKVTSVEQMGNRIVITFDKGKNYSETRVTLPGEVADKLHSKGEFETKNLDSLRRRINSIYSAEGYAFNRVKTKVLSLESGIPKVAISLVPEQQRKINGISINGYKKVPTRFIKNLEKAATGKFYDEQQLERIANNFKNHPFLQLEKPPQTLFTKDSTQIYLFIKKKKSSSFDGVLGFGNDDSQKVRLNGTLDVNFRNVFNSFETISLYWQRNSGRGQTLNFNVDIPYLFKSNVGFNFRTNIYRQDSTYATAKILPSVYYNFGSRIKFGITGSIETSTVNAQNYITGQDYLKKGIGTWAEALIPSEIEVFQYKTYVRAETDFVKNSMGKIENSLKNNQLNLFVMGEQNIHLLGNHYLNVKAESAAIISSDKHFVENELLKFGGYKSMRGFYENSLLANSYTYGGIEYRYLIGGTAFFDIFGQYGSFKNDVMNVRPKLYDFGLGFNFTLPIGLMTFQLASGNKMGVATKFSNTKIHWGLLCRF